MQNQTGSAGPRQAGDADQYQAGTAPAQPQAAMSGPAAAPDPSITLGTLGMLGTPAAPAS